MEQKNSTHIRNVLGHLRYDTEKEVEIINRLYQNNRTLQELFQPVMKLKEKIRYSQNFLLKDNGIFLHIGYNKEQAKIYL